MSNITKKAMAQSLKRMLLIKDLDKIIVVDNGKIVGKGKHEELLKTSEVYKEINDSQMRRGE